MFIPISIGSKVVTGVWVCGEFRPMDKGTVIGYDNGNYMIQRDYCLNGKPRIDIERFNYVFPLRQYTCPNCGRTVETEKGPSELKTCNNCGYQVVSPVLFEE